MLVTPQATSWSTTACAAIAGVATTPMAISSAATTAGSFVDVVHDEPVDVLADPPGVGVEQGRDTEPPLAKPA